MLSLSIDTSSLDDERRRRVFEGELFVLSQNPGVRAMVDFARDLVDEAFAPLEPRHAARLVSAARHAAVLGDLGPRFTHHRRSKSLVREILDASACDLDRTYFSPPTVSIHTCPARQASQWRRVVAWRNTWSGAPNCQVTWWLPLYSVDPATTIAFHTSHWTRPTDGDALALESVAVPGSRDECRRADSGVRDAWRDDSAYQVTIAPGSAVLYSSAHLHSVGAVPEASTIAVSFGSVHLDDLRALNGAPTPGGRSRHAVLATYLRGRDFAPLPDEVRVLYRERSLRLDERRATTRGPSEAPGPFHGPPARRDSPFRPTA